MKKGERIKIMKIIFKHHIENGDSIHPVGIIMDGEWKGEIVDLYLVSKIFKEIITNNTTYDILTNNPVYLIKSDIIVE